jgi:hypothetical protein
LRETPTANRNLSRFLIFHARNAMGKTFLALEKPEETLDKTRQKPASRQSLLHEKSNFV